jgi:hypothetical protein
MMTSLRSTLVLLGLGALAANIVIGCSDDSRTGYEPVDEDGGHASLPDTGPAPTSTGDPPPAPKPDSGTHSDAGDAGDGGHEKSDGGDVISDAGPDVAVIDSGVDAGAEGTVCPTKDVVQQQPCGLCGVQYRLCTSSDPSDSSSPNVWQPWGYCQNEVEDGCEPGTTATEGCGLCGSRSKVCQSDCRWAVGACKGEPANACSPGDEDYQIGLSCPVGGRSRTCQNNCTYSPFGACFVRGLPTLTLTNNVGDKIIDQFKLDPNKKIARLDDTCPNATLSGTNTSYQYVVLANPTSSTLTVSVWTGESTKPGAGYIDTVIASYAGGAEPTTDAQRRACVKGRKDGCSDDDPTACLSSWAGLVIDDDTQVTVPANGKVVIYVAAYYDDDFGDYQLTARIDDAQ